MCKCSSTFFFASLNCPVNLNLVVQDFNPKLVLFFKLNCSTQVIKFVSVDTAPCCTETNYCGKKFSIMLLKL